MALDRYSLHFDTEYRPPAFEHAEKEKKDKSLSCLTVQDCLLVYFTMEAEPSWKHSYVRQATLFGQVVVKNEDN